MSKKNIEIYIWPGECIDSEQKVSAHFSPLTIKIDKKAAIGAGASGLLPELSLLIVVMSSVIASGFLDAIGADIWKILKKGIANLASKKPDKKTVFIPTNLKSEMSYQLLWWIHFNDEKILIIIDLTSEKEVYDALGCLPEAIDNAFKDKIVFSRLYWNGKNWDRF